MSIASEITRLQAAKAELKTAIESKGVTVPSSAKLDAYPALVESISGGGSDEDIWWIVTWDGNIKFGLTPHPIPRTGYVEQWSYHPSMYYVRLVGDTYCEYKGEKYYMSSLDYGTMALSKTGTAAYTDNLNHFISINVLKDSNGNYYLYLEKD